MVNDLSLWILIISWENWKSDAQMVRQILKCQGRGRQEWGKAGLQGRAGEVESLGKAACDGEVEGKVPEEVKVE